MVRVRQSVYAVGDSGRNAAYSHHTELQVIPTLDSHLPDELRRWFCERNWIVLRTERVVGGFAARAIYRIRVHSPEKARASVVYKQLTPGRTTEWSVYDALSTDLVDYMPRVLARIEETSGYGLLLEDVGVPLKLVLRGRTFAEQRVLILQAVSWLTDMHIRFASRSETWLQDGVLDPYPVSSSRIWGEEALERIAWAAEAGIGKITVDHVRDLEQCAQRFYPHLETWMRGPSTVTHGDPHLENLLIRENIFKLADWEFMCVTIPQRDLAILLQDILDDELRQAAYNHFCNMLQQAGWAVDDAAFQVGWLACFFDNTLMMLGWEVFKFREGHLPIEELEVIVPAKLRWLKDTFEKLSSLAQ